MKQYIYEILKEEFLEKADEIYNNSDLLKYIDMKSSAIEGNSKTRKSLANFYAIYSIITFYLEDGFYNNPEKYKKFTGYEFTKLLLFCHSLYGGEKIQNHALNSRLNLEFDNKAASHNNKGKFLIVQLQGKYLIHIDYLYVNGIDISKIIKRIIEKYIELLKAKDDKLINDLNILIATNDENLIKEKILELLTEDSEARIFEIISYAILKNHYKNQYVYIGFSMDKLEQKYFELYKTGRTNANDGGIDFVMRPIGRFFQVTEVGNYDKYFLDIDKVVRFPMSFVIKTNKKRENIQQELNQYIDEKSGGMEVILDRYKSAIEEVITINELKDYYNNLDSEDILNILRDIILYYQLEMNMI